MDWLAGKVGESAGGPIETEIMLVLAWRGYRGKMMARSRMS